MTLATRLGCAHSVRSHRVAAWSGARDDGCADPNHAQSTHHKLWNRHVQVVVSSSEWSPRFWRAQASCRSARPMKGGSWSQAAQSAMRPKLKVDPSAVQTSKGVCFERDLSRHRHGGPSADSSARSTWLELPNPSFRFDTPSWRATIRGDGVVLPYHGSRPTCV